MGISVFPAPAAGGAAEATAFSTKLAAKFTTYEHTHDFPAGVYRVSLLNGEVSVTFASATAVIFSGITSTQALTLQLTSDATRVFITGNNQMPVDTIVTITRTSDSLTPDDIGNGTLDTINTTGTYNQTGTLAVLAFGGGAAGQANNSGSNYQGGGAGGRAGFINAGTFVTNTATTVTVGAKGVAETANTNIVAPTNSSFGNLLTTNEASNFFVNSSETNSDTNGASTVSFPSWNTTSTTGSGAGASAGDSATVRTGGGSGIGTGGSCAGLNSAGIKGGSATGKAAGGAGGKPGSNTAARKGGDGSDGVVYVLRGF
jgi:hypothetical protein